MADILILVVIAIFAIKGFKKGFAGTLVGVVTTLISMILGAFLSRPVAMLIYNSPIGAFLKGIAKNIVSANETLAAVDGYGAEAATEYIAMTISMVVSFIIVAVAVRVIAWMITDAAKIVTKIPVIKQANTILGVALGVLYGAVLCYAVLGVIRALNLSGVIENGAFISSIENSVFGSLFYFDNAVANVLSRII